MRTRFVADRITCDLYARSVDRAKKSVIYEVIVTNESDNDISCRVYGRNAAAHTLVFGMVPVAKHSTERSLVSVQLETEDDPGLFVQALGTGVDVVFDAAPARNGVVPALASGLLALLAMAAVFTVCLLGRQPIAARRVPSPVASANARAAIVPGVVVAASQTGTELGKFSYRGRWERVKNARDGRIFGSSSRTSNRGSSVSFTFIGRVVSIYGVRGPGGGHGIVTVDRSRPVRVDFYAPTKNASATIFRSPILRGGKHTVRIVALADIRDRAHRSSFVNISGAAYQ
ncbi:MAG: hypothetical protein NVS2B17_26080 [Candidatus Velthaea sp.]